LDKLTNKLLSAVYFTLAFEVKKIIWLQVFYS